jgi:hypothetical protein
MKSKLFMTCCSMETIMCLSLQKDLSVSHSAFHHLLRQSFRLGSRIQLLQYEFVCRILSHFLPLLFLMQRTVYISTHTKREGEITPKQRQLYFKVRYYSTNKTNNEYDRHCRGREVIAMLNMLRWTTENRQSQLEFCHVSIEPCYWAIDV